MGSVLFGFTRACRHMVKACRSLKLGNVVVIQRTEGREGERRKCKSVEVRVGTTIIKGRHLGDVMERLK